MSNTSLIRGGGLAAIAAGLLATAHSLTLPAVDPSAIAARPTTLIYLVGSLAMLLFLITLVGLYARQSPAIGRLGFAGFLLTFLTTALCAGVLYFQAYLMPSLALSAPEQLSPDSALLSNPRISLVLVMRLVWVLGLVLFGQVSLRLGQLPRPGLVLTMAGGVVFGLAPLFGQMPLVLSAGAVTFGMGLLWLGVSLWSPAPAARTAIA